LAAYVCGCLFDFFDYCNSGGLGLFVMLVCLFAGGFLVFIIVWCLF